MEAEGSDLESVGAKKGSVGWPLISPDTAHFSRGELPFHAYINPGLHSVKGGLEL
jgi:hypothetical protein